MFLINITRIICDIFHEKKSVKIGQMLVKVFSMLLRKTLDQYQWILFKNYFSLNKNEY